MLNGCLKSRGFLVSERHLRIAVSRIAPFQRQVGQIDRTNPQLYHAECFGEKLHIDQNEKLGMYGVTYVLARDGYSGKIIAGAVMPRKNIITIYDKIFRNTVLEYGLWDQTMEMNFIYFSTSRRNYEKIVVLLNLHHIGRPHQGKIMS